MNKLIKISLDCAHIIHVTQHEQRSKEAWTGSTCVIFYRLLSKLLYRARVRDKFDPGKIMNVIL